MTTITETPRPTPRAIVQAIPLVPEDEDAYQIDETLSAGENRRRALIHSFSNDTSLLTDDEKEILDYIQTPHSFPESWIFDLTPPLARALLKGDEPIRHNRKISWHNVEVVLHYLDVGDAMLSNDDLVVDTTGRIINGQHRLIAVALSPDSTVLPMGVKVGMPTEAQRVMDSNGARRTVSDILSLEGVERADQQAVAVQKIMSWNNVTGRYNNIDLTNAERLRLIADDPTILEACIAAREFTTHQRGKAKGSLVVGLWLIINAWPRKAQEFVTEVVTGSNPDPESATRVYGMALATGRYKSRVQTDWQTTMALVKAFNAFVTGAPFNIHIKSNEVYRAPWTPQAWSAHQRSAERGIKSAATRRAREKS